MEIFCDKPGVQFYTGNFLDSTDAGKGGTAYKQHNGFCLETQNFPDSIHQPDWPRVVLRPGVARTGFLAPGRVGWAERSESHHEADSGGTRCARPYGSLQLTGKEARSYTRVWHPRLGEKYRHAMVVRFSTKG